MFKIFVSVDQHQGFNALTVKRHQSGWTFVQQRWSFVKKFKIYWLFLLTAGYNRLQASIAVCSFLFEMNSDANIATHLSLGPNVSGQQNFTRFIDFF